MQNLLQCVPSQKQVCSLGELIQDIGTPKAIHTNGAKELTVGTWKQVCKDRGIKTTTTEKHSP
jgi:hypothetical protein